MSYYKKIPVLDAAEQAEFDKYLMEEYDLDIALAQKITESTADNHQSYQSDHERELAFQTILDKLATPRIYLLRDWIHRRQEKEATKDEGWKETGSDEK